MSRSLLFASLLVIAGAGALFAWSQGQNPTTKQALCACCVASGCTGENCNCSGICGADCQSCADCCGDCAGCASTQTVSSKATAGSCCMKK
jgi:hypothetical protein